MYGTGAVLPLDEQTVRLKLWLRSVRFTLLEAVIGVRCGMEPYAILPHAPFCFANTPQRQ